MKDLSRPTPAFLAKALGVGHERFAILRPARQSSRAAVWTRRNLQFFPAPIANLIIKSLAAEYADQEGCLLFDPQGNYFWGSVDEGQRWVKAPHVKESMLQVLLESHALTRCVLSLISPRRENNIGMTEAEVAQLSRNLKTYAEEWQIGRSREYR